MPEASLRVSLSVCAGSCLANAKCGRGRIDGRTDGRNVDKLDGRTNDALTSEPGDSRSAILPTLICNAE